MTPVTSQIHFLPTHLQKEQEEMGVRFFMHLQFLAEVFTVKQVYSKVFFAVLFCSLLGTFTYEARTDMPGQQFCGAPAPPW